MVRAILAGTKTQTRRVVKHHPSDDGNMVLVDHGDGWWPYRSDDSERPVVNGGDEIPYRCPYGQPGDRLWVRETWCCVHGVPDAGGKPHPDDFVRYRADNGPGEQVITDVKAWHPSIHMPRVYSRILLEITAVRVERVQYISQDDSVAEGCDDIRDMLLVPGRIFYAGGPREAYRVLWDSINGPGSWAANPWVWVVEFRRLP